MAWIKADAKAILAIHEHVITNNDRLSVTHSDFNTWTLVIRGVKMEDRGQYMCQVNTDPMKMQVIRATRSNLNDLVHLHMAWPSSGTVWNSYKGQITTHFPFFARFPWSLRRPSWKWSSHRTS